FVFLLMRRQPLSTLFPYTTLFRSLAGRDSRGRRGRFTRISGAPSIWRSLVGLWGSWEFMGLVPAPDGANIRRVKIQSFLSRCVLDRKSTRLNSSHDQISYAVFCLK